MRHMHGPGVPGAGAALRAHILPRVHRRLPGQQARVPDLWRVRQPPFCLLPHPGLDHRTAGQQAAALRRLLLLLARTQGTTCPQPPHSISLFLGLLLPPSISRRPLLPLSSLNPLLHAHASLQAKPAAAAESSPPRKRHRSNKVHTPATARALPASSSSSASSAPRRSTASASSGSRSARAGHARMSDRRPPAGAGSGVPMGWSSPPYNMVDLAHGHQHPRVTSQGAARGTAQYPPANQAARGIPPHTWTAQANPPGPGTGPREIIDLS